MSESVDSSVVKLCWSPTGHHLAAGDLSGGVHIYEAGEVRWATGHCMYVLVHVVEHLSAITLVILIRCQKFYDFLKAYKETFQIMRFNHKLVGALICHFSALDRGL